MNEHSDDPVVPTNDHAAVRRMVEAVVASVEARTGLLWRCLFALAVVAAVWGLGWSAWRIGAEGVGVLGVTNDVPWGLDIVHFVFWIGLGHAGTLISAVLLLTGQHWRSPIARGAELMTLCAVVCAAIFPVVHVGRIWMAWMVSPLPEVSGVWPDLSSPLVWDVLAVSTYFSLSVLYWGMGLVPDCAVLRDRCSSPWRRRLYGVLSLGWNGSGRQWTVYERCSVLLAVVLTPLVVSVHSVVSFDFAVTQVHGWHETMFPPYFVAGAILSGMAMVQLILLTVRKLSPAAVGGHITPRVVGMTSRFVLGLSLVMAVMYFWEAGTALLSGGNAWGMMAARCGDPVFWMMAACNVVVPQLFWVKRWRRSPWVVVPVACCVLVGMWSERWLIVVRSLEHGLWKAMDSQYVPTSVDVAMAVGALGLFVAMYMGMMKVAPFFSLCEMRSHLQSGVKEPVGGGDVGAERAMVKNPGEVPEESGGGTFFAFGDEDGLLRAVKSVTAANGMHVVAVSAPYPCEAVRLDEAWHGGVTRRRRLSVWGVCGGGIGVAVVVGWLYVTQVLADPLVVQGRVQGWGMWPGYVPGIFEGMLLGAGLALVFGFLVEGGFLSRRRGMFGEVEEGVIRTEEGCDFVMQVPGCSRSLVTALLEAEGMSYTVLCRDAGEGEESAGGDRVDGREAEGR